MPDCPHGFIPVLSPRFPLDTFLAPYAAQLTGQALISLPELLSAPLTRLRLPPLNLLLDSGGFAALDPHSQVTPLPGGLAALHLPDGRRVTPADVLQAAERTGAAVTFTLDFPARGDHAGTHFTANLANARWALAQPRPCPVFASVQPGQDLAPILDAHPDGIALGGLAPHARNHPHLTAEVRRVRAQIGQLPLHVFGIGHPQGVRAVMQAGATSVDSSGPQRRAASNRTWDGTHVPDPALHERVRLATLNLQASVQAAREATCTA